MAGSQPKHSADEIFDLGHLKELIQLMKAHDLMEVDLRREKHRIRISRGQIAQAWPGVAPVATSPPPAPQIAAPPSPAAATAPAKSEQHLTITSPMVGTFYSKPNPDAPNFVKVGDVVGPETVVCIIEAMKVFNEIPAEMSGRIIGIHAENGDSVEFAKPLFTLEKSGK